MDASADMAADKERWMSATMLECDFEYSGRAVGFVPRLPRGSVLGRVRFTDSFANVQLSDGTPTISLQLTHQSLDSFSEVWRTSREVHSGSHRDLVFSHDGEHLFCAGQIPSDGSCASATRAMYERAFALVGELRYPRIFRMWNFIPNINHPNAEGLEVYRDFCRGRAEAFECYQAHGHGMPAATGVGSLGGQIGFYFLAARSRGATHLENPLQQPAYTYPRDYGPRSPSFARGTYLAGVDGGSDQLYVSGTASILGHETVHAGDIVQQTQTSLRNIERLVSRTNLARYGIDADVNLSDLALVKVYVRNEMHMDVVRQACEAVLSPRTELVMLNVDICRADLLVEIEGIFPDARGSRRSRVRIPERALETSP
jgi:chorismate lyase/3-hydroxybenzoate synthase